MLANRGDPVSAEHNRRNNILYLVEHDPEVFTMGKRDTSSDLLISEEKLKSDHNIELVRTTRGGRSKDHWNHDVLMSSHMAWSGSVGWVPNHRSSSLSKQRSRVVCAISSTKHHRHHQSLRDQRRNNFGCWCVDRKQPQDMCHWSIGIPLGHHAW